MQKNIYQYFIAGFSKHDLMTLAAALAFYATLSLPALLLLLLTPVNLLGLAAKSHFFTEVKSLMGPQAGEAFKTVADNVGGWPNLGSLAGLIGVLVLLFSASGVFSQLLSSLNVIWDKQDQSGWSVFAKKRLFSVVLILAFAAIALASLITSALLAAVLPLAADVWEVTNELISTAVISCIFAAVFRVLPPKTARWRHALSGGFLSGVLFTIGKTLIGLYLGKSAMSSQYGAAGSLIVLLIWIYYSSLIFFMGAELTRAADSVDEASSHLTTGKK